MQAVLIGDARSRHSRRFSEDHRRLIAGGVRPRLTHRPCACPIRRGGNRFDRRMHQIVVANGVTKPFVALFAGEKMTIKTTPRVAQ